MCQLKFEREVNDMQNKCGVWPALIVGALAQGVFAGETAESTRTQTAEADLNEALPSVEVAESVEKAATFSGSTSVIDKQTLERDQVFTVNEALRKAPGVYVRDEEGFGLRPNIAFRGQNPFRSTKVLFLEDGIPFNFAPYGDNDIYYHPPIERYDGIEIYKGADLTQFGPQTINGAINYLTPKVPTTPGGFVSFTGGNRDYLNGHARYGGMVKNVQGLDAVGGVVDYIHKEGMENRDNTFAVVDDANLKSIIDFDARNRLTLRGDFYHQDEQGAAFGLTDAEYRKLGARYNPDKNASFINDRWSTSATYEHNFNKDVTLETSFYWSAYERNWWRQQNQFPTENQCSSLGIANYVQNRENGIAVDMNDCNYNIGRKRNYETWGIAPTLHAKHDLFGVESHLDAGFRAHFENQYRRQIQGSSPTARDGTLLENNQRFADAYSGFFQNQFIWGNWTATPGVRVESVSYQRKDVRTGIAGGNGMTEILPSFAVTYSPIDQATLFFGIHRGFAPPRVEDSVNNANGAAVEIGPEISWNAEFGVRARPARGVKAEVTYFHNDFDTLTALGTVGGVDTPVAQGKALYDGLELMARADLGDVFGWAHNPYAQVAYTWLPTAETTSPFHCLTDSGQATGSSQNATFTRFCPGGNVFGSAAGKRAPYAPENLLTATLGYSHASGFDAHLEAVFVGEQFADFMNLNSAGDLPLDVGTTAQRNALIKSGQFGKINDYVVVNFASSYKVRKDLTLFVSMKNMLDNTYIVDRVRGIQPGAPRLVQAGFKYEF
ncbi:TonB-dependent receptor family protein [Methylomonas sp. MED-D]|uniref:TonB-dependent receptor family protein n=1 Tax=unclassified Methylomonas TaxID=2608980 RepID=UPI0028A33250|nr:TonB-dependent receptor [Methylomonas sp. MV1]MDT4332150.1 TonB-dependent receptor [Methylomonas sp. MV1]